MRSSPCIPSAMCLKEHNFPETEQVSGFHFSIPSSIDLSGVMYMGYRIVYGEGPVVWKNEKIRWGRVLLFGASCFAAFCMLTIHFWPEGSQILQQMLYPGDLRDTQAALHHLATRLRAGEALSDAVFVFCQEIVDGAKYPG